MFKRIIPDDDDKLRHVCSSCGSVYYDNPKNIVGVLPLYQDKILLCKRNIEPCKGLWTLPAGFMEIGESLEEGALREAKEEAGVSPTIDRLFSIYNIPRIGQVYFIFLAHCKTDTIKIGQETQEAVWFDMDSLPIKEVAFSSVRSVLADYTAIKQAKKALPEAPIIKSYSKKD